MISFWTGPLKPMNSNGEVRNIFESVAPSWMVLLAGISTRLPTAASCLPLLVEFFWSTDKQIDLRRRPLRANGIIFFFLAAAPKLWFAMVPPSNETVDRRVEHFDGCRINKASSTLLRRIGIFTGRPNSATECACVRVSGISIFQKRLTNNSFFTTSCRSSEYRIQ